MPPPQTHRHRYHGVFAPPHKLRLAVTALAIGNVGKRGDPASSLFRPPDPGDGASNVSTERAATDAPRAHDTSRIAWAQLLARIAEAFPLVCFVCGGDIRLIAFIVDPGPIHKLLCHIGEPVDPLRYDLQPHVMQPPVAEVPLTVLSLLPTGTAW